MWENTELLYFLGSCQFTFAEYQTRIITRVQQDGIDLQNHTFVKPLKQDHNSVPSGIRFPGKLRVRRLTAVWCRVLCYMGGVTNKGIWCLLGRMEVGGSSL